MELGDMEGGSLGQGPWGTLVGEDGLGEERKVSTVWGRVCVGVSGTPGKPALLTLHDLGLNGNSCFQSFFQFSDMAEVMERFSVAHVTLPGQEDEAEALAEGAPYPSLDDMASLVERVREELGLKSFVGVGVGVGANVLLRYAVRFPQRTDGLVLLNTLAQNCGWIEWGYQSANLKYLRDGRMTTLTQDYLMWHHFGRNLDQHHPDMVMSYKQYFARLSCPGNLAALIQAVISRTPLPVAKDAAGESNVKCPVLQMVGASSPFVEDTVTVNTRLDPSRSDWMKLQDASGLLLEEQPEKACEAILLFLQGVGYYPSFSHCQWVAKRRASNSHTPALHASPDKAPLPNHPVDSPIRELKV